jgi:large subunit ribosomal protein L10
VRRSEKVKFVEELTESFGTTPHVVLASFRGLTVNQVNDLRRRIGFAGGSFRVIKNRLAKRAAAGTAVEPLSQSFRGPCALASHGSDPVLLAKTIADFAKDNPQIELMAGLVDAREVVDAVGVRQLATMPSLPELRAQLLALVLTPATMLVRLIGTPATQIARVLDARRERIEEGAEE